MLSDEEIIRYQRQLPMEGWGADVQEKLERAVVFIAGAGGLGSPVSLYLAAAGVGTLRICDSDRIERSNLNRQVLYSTEEIGRRKVDAAGDALTGLNPHVRIVGLPDRLDETNGASLIGDAELIIDCLDSIGSRYVLNRMSVEKRIPLIHAGVMGLSGQVTFLLPPETPCLACFIRGENVAAASAVVGPAPGLIGSLQAMEALKYLTGIGTNLKGRLLMVDGEEGRFETIGIEKDPDCPVCGKLQKAFESERGENDV